MQPGRQTIRPELDLRTARKILRDHDAASAIVASDGELLGIRRRVAQPRDRPPQIVDQ
jgi:hypothetical protein